MRMTISLQKELLEEAQSLLKKKNKKEVIEDALRELIRKKRREEAIKHAGKVEIDITLNEFLSLREQG